MPASRRDIPLTFVDSQVDKGVATLTIRRPLAGNALNWALLEQIRVAVKQATDSPDVKAIVIAAAGSRFVSGADLSFFVRCLESGDVLRIVDSIRASQEIFAQIAECPKPVVAAVQGAAVGGGVELALACHRIVATPRASFSFPETGLGILPSSGGTYRTPCRIGRDLTKWLIYTGHLVAPPMALKLGLIDELVMPEQLPEAAKTAAAAMCCAPTAAPREVAAVVAEFAALQTLFARATVAELRAAELPKERILAAALKAIAMRPAPALQWSETLIDTAIGHTMQEGAAAALAVVPVLFSDPHVLERLARVAKQQRHA